MEQSKENWHLISDVMHGNGGMSVIFKAKFDSQYVKYRGRTYKSAKIDMRNTTNIRNIFGMRHWDIAIKVGIIDDNKEHLSYNGGSVSYEKLFAGLRHNGYDPLLPIREKAFQDKVSRVIGLKILQANKRINNGSHTSIRAQLIPYANEIRDFCRDYIRGGIPPGKPALANETLRIREWKSGVDEMWFSYKYGIGEALWETGQLEQAIECDVYVDETQRELISRRDKYAMKVYSRKQKEGRARKAAESAGKRTIDYGDDSAKSWAGAEIRDGKSVSKKAITAQKAKDDKIIERVAKVISSRSKVNRIPDIGMTDEEWRASQFVDPKYKFDDIIGD